MVKTTSAKKVRVGKTYPYVKMPKFVDSMFDDIVSIIYSDKIPVYVVLSPRDNNVIQKAVEFLSELESKATEE